MTNNLERAVARTKSYIGASLVVFLLYGFAWLPGFIANLMYYNEAKKMEYTAGQSLPGVGCLAVMLWLNIIGLLVSVLFVLAMLFLGGANW